MSGLAIRGVEGREGLVLVLEETVKVFSLQVCVYICALGRCWRGGVAGGGGGA